MGIGLGQKLKAAGKKSVAVLAALLPPSVHQLELIDALGYVENAGVPTSVTPDFIGQLLFDTSGLDFYMAFGTSSGNWAPVGVDTETFTELALLDGAALGNATAGKAAIIDAAGTLSLPTAVHNTAGAGITGGTGTIFKTSVSKEGGIIKTQILIDLTGAGSSTTDLDIIGQGSSAAHLGQITAALNGTILAGVLTCLEAPTGGINDIDLYWATEATGKFDDAVSGLTETALITSGGAWTLALSKAIADPVGIANGYLYLTGGAGGTAATYTAGKFLLTLYGY